jgi:thiol-disulfide isomerase/thioredoxin
VRASTLGICAFFLAFAAYSGKVKRDIALKEGLASFSGTVSYGDAPPDFELHSVDGAAFRLADETKGKKVVLINFWATWCPPCRLEMPQLEALYQRYRDSGLQILAVNVGEEEQTIRAFLATRPLSFPVLRDSDQSIAARYRIEAFPTTVLLDAEGKVIDVTEGLDPYLAYRVESQITDDESDAEDEEP